MSITQRWRDDMYREVANVFYPELTAFSFDYTPMTATIEHLPTRSRFKVKEEVIYGFVGFDLNWHVHDGPRSVRAEKCANWEDVLSTLTVWAIEVQYVAENKDLWAELKRSAEIQALTDSPYGGNAPFTAEEQAEIEARVEVVKAEAHQNPELMAEQVSGIEHKLDELADASKRVNKKDWLVMAYGYGFAMVANDLVHARVVQEILITLITGLGHIFGIGGLPPSLPPQA